MSSTAFFSERAQDLLQRATQLPPGERAAFLRESCGDDPRLAERLQAVLVSWDRHSGRFGQGFVGDMVAGVMRESDSASPSLTGRRFSTLLVGEQLGSGGMGVVYQARDERLGRDVALKVFGGVWTGGPEQRARLEREARALAALNHPRIAAVYGLQELDSSQQVAIVMELVPGRTLEEVLREGPLEWRETVGIACQVCEGLEAAHARGIVHRDLKPANIRITPEGGVKLLDFGLAKAWAEPDIASGTGTPTPSSLTPTITLEGRLIGTPAYMSPEQARGRAVDRRSDIWALGCLIYEMLMGEALFRRANHAETIDAVLHLEPDLSVLASRAPAGLVDVLRRCLKRDVDRRQRDAGDLRLALEECLASDHAPSPPRRNRLPLAIWAAVTLAAIAAAVVMWRDRPTGTSPTPGTTTRLSIDLPPLTSLSQSMPGLCVSPDGAMVAYAAAKEGSEKHIYIRRMNEFDAHEIPGSETGDSPFFACDGRSVYFNSFKSERDQLCVAPTNGGPATAVSEFIPESAIGLPDGSILASRTWSSGLYLLRPSGSGFGAPEHLALDGRDANCTSLLPDGTHVIATLSDPTGPKDGASIEVVDLRTFKTTPLVSDASNGHFVDGGYLVYSKDGVLLGVRFDPASLRVTGSPVPLAQGVACQGSHGPAALSVGRSGTLAYATGPIRLADSDLLWHARDGTPTLIRREESGFTDPQLSPDGLRIAYCRPHGNNGVLTLDLSRPQSAPLQVVAGLVCRQPFWSPDGRSLAFVAAHETGRNWPFLYLAPVDGSLRPRVLFESEGESSLRVWGWTHDGAAICVTEERLVSGARTVRNLRVPVDGGAPTELHLPERDVQAVVPSPDGRWLAYSTSESGDNEVFIRSWPSLGPRTRISTGGGMRPVWRDDSRELYYESRDGGVWATRINAEGPAVTEPALRLFTERVWGRYDAAPDGSRFLSSRGANDMIRWNRIYIVLNWRDELTHALR